MSTENRQMRTVFQLRWSHCTKLIPEKRTHRVFAKLGTTTLQPLARENVRILQHINTNLTEDLAEMLWAYILKFINVCVIIKTNYTDFDWVYIRPLRQTALERSCHVRLLSRREMDRSPNNRRHVNTFLRPNQTL